jgi:hypothetical protein
VCSYVRFGLKAVHGDTLPYIHAVRVTSLVAEYEISVVANAGKMRALQHLCLYPGLYILLFHNAVHLL